MCKMLRVTKIDKIQVTTWELHWSSEMGQYRTTVSDGWKGERGDKCFRCPMDTEGTGVAMESYTKHQDLLRAHVDHVRKVRRCEKWVAKVAAGGS